MNLSHTETHKINDISVTKTVKLEFSGAYTDDMANKFDALVARTFPNEPDPMELKQPSKIHGAGTG